MVVTPVFNELCYCLFFHLCHTATCLDVLGKVNINHEYTCYNHSSNEFLISIGIGDIAIEKLIISVSGSGSSNSYELNKTGGSAGLKNYTGGTDVKMPDQNSGLTYRLSVSGRPDSVRIFPVTGGKQCDATDSATGISSCLLLS